jgi:hypothetical protein
MGWSYGWKSKAALVEYLTAGSPRTFAPFNPKYPDFRARWYSREVVKHTLVGNELWVVLRTKYEYAEHATAPVTETKIDTAIVVCLIESENGDWGYKDMSEEEGPYYYGCPLNYLALAPETNSEWRAGVRAAHAKKNAVRKIEVGDTLTLADGCNPSSVTVVSVKPLTGKAADGLVYKIAKKLVQSVARPALAAV